MKKGPSQPVPGIVGSVCEAIFRISFRKSSFLESDLEDKSLVVNGSRLHGIMEDLAGHGFVKLSGDRIETQSRLYLAEILVKAGRSPATLSVLLSWREFEGFCRDALEASGFVVRSNVRFTWQRKRHEIDLVAAKTPFLLFIDCKHWKPERPAGYKAAARKQRLRMEAALEEESAIMIGTTKSRSFSKPLSLIVSLADVALREADGIPVVSIFRLNNFLLELDRYWDELEVQSTGF